MVVYNTTAAGNNSRKSSQILSDLQILHGVDVLATNSLAELGIAADEIATRRPDRVVIAGGDGTVSHTITALSHRLGNNLPQFIIHPGGSMNMVANSIGASRDVVSFIKDLNNGHRCKTVQRDLLQAGDRCGFIFGVGLVTNFLELYYSGTTTGPTRAAATLAQAIGSTLAGTDTGKQVFQRCRGQLSMNETSEIRHWTVVLVQTIENLGIGFRPSYRAFEKQGTFHVLATDVSPLKLISHLSHIYRGRPWPESVSILDEVSGQLKFRSSERFCYTVDGELLYADKEVNVKIRPPVTFVVPDV